MSKRKKESWANTKLSDPHELAKTLHGFSSREQVILVCSFLDSLLADLIAKHLRSDEKEIANFLGYEDGRAALGSFGSRIQLAYLLSLIDKNELKILRAVKNVRNVFAHHVICSFDDDDVAEATKQIVQLLEQAGDKYFEAGREKLSDMEWETSKEQYLKSKDGRIGYFIGSAVLLITHLKKLLKPK